MPRIYVRLAGALALIPTLVSAQVLLGPEFQVNTYTTFSQEAPSVASDGAGNFMVVWQNTGLGSSIFGRRFDAAGTPVGVAEFRVNSLTTGGHLQPRVASSATGEAVVVWNSTQDGSSWGVLGRRFDANGAPSAEFLVNSYTTGGQQNPSIGSDASGNFVVAWVGLGPGGGGIFARRYAAGGTPLGDEFRVNTYTTVSGSPSVAVASTGSFVIVWEMYRAGADTFMVGQLYDPAGAPVGGEFPVSSHATGVKHRPSVSTDAEGNFVVVWDSSGQDGSGYAVVGRRFDAAGAPLGGEFIVNSYTTGQQTAARVQHEPDGHFVIVWQSDGQDGDDNGIFARRYDAAGAADSTEFRLNVHTTNHQSGSDIALGHRGFVAVWHSFEQDGSANGVFGQRFAADVIFRDGFDDGTLDLWSAANTDGGDLGVSTVAAMKLTTAGLRAVVDDTAGLYVQDDSPENEERYRARFYFDTNGFDPGEAQGRFRTRLFIAFEENPTRRLAAIVLRRQGGAYSLRGRLRRADGSQLDTPFVPIADGPHFVEIDWQRARGIGRNAGWLDVSVDGIPAGSMPLEENNPHFVDFVRLGALSVKAGANGVLYWDEFESRRGSAIGP